MVINKRVGLSFLTIAGVLTAVVGITFAAFSDTATLTSNTLSTGSADLRIAAFTADCANETYTDSIPGITTTNIAPGGTASKQFCLKNFSTTDISLDVSAALANVTSTFPDPTLVTITVTCASPSSGNLNGIPSTSIVVLSQGSSQQCTITQSLSSSADNNSANKTATYDVTFTGVQQ